MALVTLRDKQTKIISISSSFFIISSHDDNIEF